MVGYLYRAPERRFRLKIEPVAFHGLLFMGAGLPRGELARRLDQGAKALRKKGCARVLAARSLDCMELPEILRRNGLAPVDPLPLYRAKAPELALALVEKLPLRRRCVALRGEGAQAAWPAAAFLCPQVGALLLDFQWGEEELSRRLREVYGAAALNLRQGPPPQASVEFSPCGEPEGKTLRLWGEPELAGCRLTANGVDDPALLTLLWETGRLRLGDIAVQWGEWP